jgi:hypothetical protein
MEKKPPYPMPPKMPPQPPHAPIMPPEQPEMPHYPEPMPPVMPMPQDPGMMHLPCDPHLLREMYHQMKIHHRYELQMLKWYMRYCAKKHHCGRRTRMPWSSSWRHESTRYHGEPPMPHEPPKHRESSRHCKPPKHHESSWRCKHPKRHESSWRCKPPRHHESWRGWRESSCFSC